MFQSTTNGRAASESTPLVIPSGEDTPSVVRPGANPSTNGTANDNDSPASVESQKLWDELEQPWPSTFGRSIALLASPVQTPIQVDYFTKSPKPGSTPAALARRRDLRRGYYTPSPHGAFLGPIGRHNSVDLTSSERAFRQGAMEKVKSLDFQSKKEQLFQAATSLEEAQKKQQEKAKAAKEYRAKILQQSGKQQHPEADSLLSPGFQKETASKKRAAAKKEVQPAELEGKSTFAQCAFNLANILMGVGLLGLPFSLRAAGWIGGLFCLAVFGLITWRTSILIGRELNGDPRPSHYFVDSPFKSPLQPGSVPEARLFAPIQTFPDIARAAFGDSGCFVLSVVLYFELFSCIAIFFVAIGDHLHQLFPSVGASSHAMIAAATSLVPTMVLRTPALLSYLSMVGTFATISVVGSVAAEAMLEGDISAQVAEQFHIADAQPYHIWWNTSGLSLSFGLVAYCFSGHAIVPSIYSSMKRPQDFEKMVTVTYLIVALTCVVVAASGYYMFGSTVLDQITLSLERSSHAATAMKALTWLMILTGEWFQTLLKSAEYGGLTPNLML